ncbi:MAG: C10 family peptidase [Syntrophales bacterium]|jgi:hypothetical protein|nr:C10 family peptidase [Syntrophales bacterium]MDY0044336.1 C10 family peptidase [Syntrophales bacterium]
MKNTIRRTIIFSTVLTLLIFSFSGVHHACAESEDYTIIVENFLSYIKSGKEILAAELIFRNETAPLLPEIETAFLAHLAGGGYVLVAASRHFTPVKAYSLSANFTELPGWYREYLLNEMEYNARAAASLVTVQGAGSTETEARWDFLLTYHLMKSPLYIPAPDQWLLQTKWAQGYPYNKFLPRIEGERVAAGCVNVAMAQLMRYYRFPARGSGAAVHMWNGEPLEAVLDRSFDWDRMPSIIAGNTPEHEVDEIALLLLDLAIINETSFGISGSSASPHIAALQEHFGYSSAVAEINNSDAEAFLNALKSEIGRDNPVLLSFLGSPEYPAAHMVVADGYSSGSEGDKIHVNMGWGGTDDNFYYLDRVVETGGYDFAPVLKIYTNVIPCSEIAGDCCRNLEDGDGMEGFTVTGQFDSGLDADRFEVYLKGETAITAVRGWEYGNVGFFISLYDLFDGALILRLDGTQASGIAAAPVTLPSGKYRMVVSLHEGSSYWPFEQGNNSYTVEIATTSMTSEEVATIDASLDSPPAILSDLPDIVLDGEPPSSQVIRIDARDCNGDDLTLEVSSTNPSAVAAAFTGDLLTVTPLTGSLNKAATITVTATAGGKSVEKSFVVMVSDEKTVYGSEFVLRGLFAARDQFDTFRVILEGTSTIKGKNGYANQGFYSSVSTSDNSFIISPVSPLADECIEHPFSRDIYNIGASLEENPGGAGGYYELIENENDSYYLFVKCPDLIMNTSDVASLLDIDLAGIEPVGLAEAIEALRFLSGFPLGQSPGRIDITCNGKIDLSDVLLILQRISGIRD